MHVFRDLPEKFDHGDYAKVYKDFILRINTLVQEKKLNLQDLHAEISSEVQQPPVCADGVDDEEERTEASKYDKDELSDDE